MVIVSRNAINASSTAVLAVPCTSYRGRRIYPSQVLLRAPEGGLDVDTVVMAEQVHVIDQVRLLRRRGMLGPQALAQLEAALLIAFDLPGQGVEAAPA